MSTILKRILTRKSIIGFGTSDYRDLSVQMVMDLKKSNFLINAYFNLEKIGFTEDILDELGITKEYRIEKPGKNSELREKFYTDRLSNMNEIEKMNYYNRRENEEKHRIGRAKRSAVRFRSESMRAKNHGNK